MHLFALHYSYRKQDVLQLTQKQFEGLLKKIGQSIEGEMKFQASLRGLKFKPSGSQEDYDDDSTNDERQASHDHAMRAYEDSLK